MTRASIVGVAAIADERTSVSHLMKCRSSIGSERPCSCSAKVLEGACEAQNYSHIKLLQCFNSFLSLAQIGPHLAVPCGSVPLACRG